MVSTAAAVSTGAAGKGKARAEPAAAPVDEEPAAAPVDEGLAAAEAVLAEAEAALAAGGAVACDDAGDGAVACDDAGAALRKRRRHALRGAGTSIPREVVRQAVRDLVDALPSDVRVDRSGVDALHVALEAYAIDVFTMSEELVQLAGRTTVTPLFMASADRMYKRMRQAVATA